VIDQLAKVQVVQFTGKGFQQGECAASITVWIRERVVALFESVHGVAQPFEFVKGGLEFRVRHILPYGLAS
jgi:hypothetical protein